MNTPHAPPSTNPSYFQSLVCPPPKQFNLATFEKTEDYDNGGIFKEQTKGGGSFHTSIKFPLHQIIFQVAVSLAPPKDSSGIQVGATVGSVHTPPIDLLFRACRGLRASKRPPPTQQRDEDGFLHADGGGSCEGGSERDFQLFQISEGLWVKSGVLESHHRNCL